MPKLLTPAVVLLLAVCLVLAQQPADKKAPAKTAGFSEGKLEAERPSVPNDFNDMRRLVQGNDLQPANPKAVMEKMSRWLVNRLTWPEVHENREGYPSIGDIMDGRNPNQLTLPNSVDWDGALKAIPKAQRALQVKFLKEFRPIMVKDIENVVFRNQALIARVNAARLLHRWAEVGQEEVADQLIAIIKNAEETDAVKYWAFKGLKELFDQSAFKPPANKKAPNRFEDCGLLLCDELQKRLQVDPAIFDQRETQKHLEEEGFRIVRRQIIIALGSIRQPWVFEGKRAGLVGGAPERKGPVASLLLDVLTKEDLYPSPSWHERVEVAYALCQIKVAKESTYQPDVALYHVGRFMADLTRVRPEKEAKTLKWFAWRLHEGVEGFPEKGRPYYQAFKRRAEPALRNLHDQSNPEGPDQLRQWVETSEPKIKTIYDPPPTSP